MQSSRRVILCGLVCGTVGAARGSVQPPPAYFDFFGSPVRPERYLRNMYDLVQIQRVGKPSFQGNQSLEMQFRFSRKYRKGQLLWDLPLVRFDRFRIRIWNPNSPRDKIYLKAFVTDVAGCVWAIPYLDEKKGGIRPLPESEKEGWVVFDGTSADAECVRGQPDGRLHPLARLSLVFEVHTNFKAFDQPVTLYLDGLECF